MEIYINQDNIDDIEDIDNTVAKIHINETYLTTINFNLYFTSLIYLDCKDNYIKELPNLNYFTYLAYIDCSKNKLNKLPLLPISIQEINCSYNRLTNLPVLPINLQSIDYGGNFITETPDLSYLEHLVRADCYKNKITNITTTTEYINCSQNELSNIIFNHNIVDINCCHNRLSSLPNMSLFIHLRIIDCSHNELSELPILKQLTQLEELYCNNNNLSNLPSLPNNLKKLYCNNNKLIDINIHSLTNLEEINFSNNLISEFPDLTQLSILHLLKCKNNKFPAEIDCITEIIELSTQDKIKLLIPYSMVENYVYVGL
jgi:Leucine-rich repeat (LRR) protein